MNQNPPKESFHEIQFHPSLRTERETLTPSLTLLCYFKGRLTDERHRLLLVVAEGAFAPILGAPDHTWKQGKHGTLDLALSTVTYRIVIRRPRPTQGGARQGIMIDPPELNGLKLWRRGGFRCFWEAGKLLAGYWWKLFGRLVSGGKC